MQSRQNETQATAAKYEGFLRNNVKIAMDLEEVGGERLEADLR